MELGACHRPGRLFTARGHPAGGMDGASLLSPFCPLHQAPGDQHRGTARSGGGLGRSWGGPHLARPTRGAPGHPLPGHPLTQAQLISDAGVSGGQTQAREGLDPRIAQTQPLWEAGVPWIPGTESPAEIPQGSECVCVLGAEFLLCPHRTPRAGIHCTYTMHQAPMCTL